MGLQNRACFDLAGGFRLVPGNSGPMPYVALQSIVENFNPPGMRNYWKSEF